MIQRWDQEGYKKMHSLPSTKILGEEMKTRHASHKIISAAIDCYNNTYFKMGKI